MLKAPAKISWHVLLFVATLVATLATVPVSTLADIHDSFESLEATWRMADYDCAARILDHERTLESAHSGGVSEFFRLSNGNGTFLYIVHDIPHARVIRELVPSVWVKSHRPELQILARVVFPYTVGEGREKPISALLRGDSYTAVGSWQQLRVTNIERLLQRESVHLRSKFGSNIDLRAAYIDLVVVNAFSRAGVTELWLDDLEVHGIATASGGQAGRAPYMAQPQIQLVSHTDDGNLGATGSAELQGDILIAAGKPIMPRVVDWNGESFEFLRSLGFNAIRYRGKMAEHQLADLRRLGMGLVGGMPNLPAGMTSSGIPLGWLAVYGGDASPLAVSGTNLSWIAQVRSQAAWNRLPLVGGASARFPLAASPWDIDCIQERPLASSLDLERVADLYRQQQTKQQVRRVWAELQSEVSPIVLEQISALAPLASSEIDLEVDQICSQAMAAIGAGIRGYVCSSYNRLDLESRNQRANALRWLNEQVTAAEPWCAGGSFVGPLTHDRVAIGEWKTDRAQLFVLVQRQHGEQCVTGPGFKEPITFVTRTNQPTAQAYMLTPFGIAPLNSQREAGGLRILCGTISRLAFVVVTADSVVLNHLVKSLADRKASIAALRIELLEQRLRETDDVVRVAKAVSINNDALESQMDDLRSNVRQCVRLLQNSDYQNMHLFCDKTWEQFSRFRQAVWRQSVPNIQLVGGNPGTVLFSTLPHLWFSAETLTTSVWKELPIPESDFENLDRLLDAGWRQAKHAEEDEEPSAELSALSPKLGSLSLHLFHAPKERPKKTMRSRISISTPPINVQSGQWIRIQGWVRIPHPLDSPDGACVLDSIGGEELMPRFHATKDWERFTIYRAVGRSTPLTIYLTLTGSGDVYWDDLRVSYLDIGEKARK